MEMTVWPMLRVETINVPLAGFQSLYPFTIWCKNVKLNGGVNIIRYWCNSQSFHFITQVLSCNSFCVGLNSKVPTESLMSDKALILSGPCVSICNWWSGVDSIGP